MGIGTRIENNPIVAEAYLMELIEQCPLMVGLVIVQMELWVSLLKRFKICLKAPPPIYRWFPFA